MLKEATKRSYTIYLIYDYSFYHYTNVYSSCIIIYYYILYSADTSTIYISSYRHNLLRRYSSYLDRYIHQVFFDYPKDLKKVREDTYRFDPDDGRKLRYNSYWERICIKNAFLRAGFEKSDKNWTVLWSKHQKSQSFKMFNCLQKVNHFPASWSYRNTPKKVNRRRRIRQFSSS